MCEVISLEYKYLGGVQGGPEIEPANHSKALSTFQILHNPQASVRYLPTEGSISQTQL